MIDQTEFDRVVPAILDMGQKIRFILDVMFPEAALPDGFFPAQDMARTQVSGGHAAGKPRLDRAHPR